MTKSPLLTPLMRWFLLAMILANIAGGMINMLMPVYLTRLGASIGQVGMVFTVTSVVVLVLQIGGGWISDSIGRLRAIAIGSVGGVISFLAMLVAPSWHWMLLALALNQVPYAIVGPSFSAFIAENSSEENRGRVYGVTDTLYQIVGLVGPPLGGFLAGRYGFKYLLVAATLFYSSAAGLRIWMARTMRPESEREPRKLSVSSFKESFKLVGGLIIGGGIITWILITDGVQDIAFRMSGDLQPLYLEQVIGLPLEQIGLLGGFFSAAMMLTPILSGRVADRYGERVPITAGFFVVFVSMYLFVQTTTFAGFALVWVLVGLGVGLLSPAYQSLVSKVVPRQSLGAFTGLFRGSIGFISLPAPWIGATLWETVNPRLPFQITAAACLITILPAWFKFKLPKKPAEEALEPASE